VDLRELDLESWRKTIGVVSQDVFLFNDTVANNIALWRPEASQESIIEAAKQAYAHEFIQQMPEGYETTIGDRGWNLSGGQRQRLALARAIFSKPEVLILDEATSSLDSESERFIQEYINEIRGTRTLVVVAHRMSTIRGADKIVVLEEGKIVEEGDLNSLLAASGPFARFYRLQFSGQEALIAPES
jgi:subfamily B ATP-binding cassette protein MsbA